MYDLREMKLVCRKTENCVECEFFERCTYSEEFFNFIDQNNIINLPEWWTEEQIKKIEKNKKNT
jgi:hypothetical protein